MRRSLTMVGATDAERAGGEYQVVSLRPSAGAVSVGLALVVVLARQLVARVLFGWFGWVPENPWAWPLAIAGTSFAAALLGLGFGLAGLRRRSDRSRTLAFFGVIANATALVLLTLMAAAFTYIRWR